MSDLTHEQKLTHVVTHPTDGPKVETYGHSGPGDSCPHCFDVDARPDRDQGAKPSVNPEPVTSKQGKDTGGLWTNK